MLFCISIAKKQLCVATEVANVWNTVHSFHTHVITEKRTCSNGHLIKRNGFNHILQVPLLISLSLSSTLILGRRPSPLVQLALSLYRPTPSTLDHLKTVENNLTAYGKIIQFEQYLASQLTFAIL
jgi:hypothetical protein